MELRKLLNSFEVLEAAGCLEHYQESAIYQLVDHLGELALPVLMRKLLSSTKSGHWASVLLLRLAQEQEPGLEARITDSLREHAASPYLQDRYKLLCASVLATLSDQHEPLPTLILPEASAEISLVELAECMSSAAEVARAVDILMDDLPPQELIEFVEDFAAHQAPSAHLMLSELLLRDDLALATHTRLRQVRLSLPAPLPKAEAVPLRPGLRAAGHKDGRSALVCYAKIVAQCPIRYRAISFAIGADHSLLDCQYLETATRSEVDRQLLSPFATHGYDLTRIGQGAAKTMAVAAVLARRRAGLPLPRDYYLGRDLVNISDEHCAGRDERRADNAALLARGTELMNRNQLDTARELLVRYAEQRPDDSEAMATLGACLMKRGEMVRARAHLARAAWLAPQVGRHHWNGASLAHEEGRLGDCFVALQHYLRCVDAVDTKQRQQAEAFVADYSRRAALRGVSATIPAGASPNAGRRASLGLVEN